MYSYSPHIFREAEKYLRRSKSNKQIHRIDIPCITGFVYRLEVIGGEAI